MTQGPTRPLTVLLVHNRYQQAGGEDAAVIADAELLAARGHRVVRHERSNDEIMAAGPVARARVAADSIWSSRSARALGSLIDDEQPDVVHVHNTFPLLSPAVFSAARRRQVPVVATIHNYRLICAAATCTRDGHPCTDCVGRLLPWPAVRHRCYHDSAAQSGVVAAMQIAQRVARTWAGQVGVNVVVSEFTARTLVAAGALPATRVTVRYNFCAPDPGARDPGEDRGGVLFAGRLVPEKGIEVLIRAAAAAPEVPIVVAGDGPGRSKAETLARRLGAENISFLGQLPKDRLLDALRAARCLVFPSVWDEPFPMVLVEAAAVGVPAIASKVGGVPEIVSSATGELVPPGDPEALAAALVSAHRDPDRWRGRGIAARRLYEERFAADHAYDQLLEAYRRAGVRVA